MAFADLDELVVLGTNATVSKMEVSFRPLQNYLVDFEAKHGDEYGAIFLQSVSFGKNVEDETKLELLIDCTWRKDLNLSLDEHCCHSRN
mmetsp:Transcript_10074/g.11506  ORF Transcript_10074/g.11506 Transcript_10074/m.11506 type:complete len:89 (+) Transcript_10074:3-269(+)